MLGLLWLVPAVPFAGALVLILAGARLRRTGVAVVGAGSVGVSAIIAALIAIRFVTLPPAEGFFTQRLWTWIRVGGFAP